MKISKILLAVFLSASVLFFSCKPKDSDVQAKITEKFAATPECSGASASVTDGVATLTGQVKDDACKNMAENTAKDIKGVKSVVNDLTTTPPPPPPAPAVNPDSELTKGVTDATKDFPTVTAAVNNGEITLTGSIKRADLQKLMQTLNTLKPKKINNQLTIK
ncbi:MAG TPA: BON domain-containing protein [Hanamia sp.]|nr:BON domain-containing protein [Hanamia sp.]